MPVVLLRQAYFLFAECFVSIAGDFEFPHL